MQKGGEFYTGTEYPHFHGCDRESGRSRNILVGKLLLRAEQQQHPFSFGQGVNCSQRLPEFVMIDCGLVGLNRMVRHRFIKDFQTRLAAPLLAVEVSRDGE